jgi:hypothetical protein
MNPTSYFFRRKLMKLSKTTQVAVSLCGILLSITSCNTTKTPSESAAPSVKFVVTDAMQRQCFDNEGNVIAPPNPGELYYGQDAQNQGILPSYTDNGDGTITDNNSGLVWQKTPPSDKMFYSEAVEYVENLELAGYSDWRLPNIKESFSIALLDGKLNVEDTSLAKPYIDSEYFDFTYDQAKPYTGSYWTSTVCKMPANNDYELMEKNYGFNWADGHLKSYGDGYNIDGSASEHQIPAGVRAVRGEENVYGVNDFEDNKDGTITDKATGFMWSQQDSGAVNDDGTIRKESDSDFGKGRTWVDTLAWVEKMNEVNYLGYSDWRLPDIKELQSIVQYGKTEIPATDSEFFNFSRPDCFVWSSTTCGDFPEMADYIAFGKGYGIDLIVRMETMGLRAPMGPPPAGAEKSAPAKSPEPGKSESTIDFASMTTVDDFVDVHGPGCMRADYKDTNGYVSQAPELSRTFWEHIYGVEYPYPVDENNTTTEFDLSFSENAADYIVLYNYALLVRDVE